MVHINKSPMQDIFDYFYALSEEWGYETYDYLPSDKEASYPFVYVGAVEEIPNSTKTSLSGSVTITVDVWGTRNERLTIGEMVERFFYAAIGHIQTDNRRYYGNPQDQLKRVLLDTSVPNTTLLHGVVNIELKII